MEEFKHCGHQHPLVLLNERQMSKLSEKAECWMCGDKASAPCFGCQECHAFYLHKSCADAPSQITHPFHQNHPLLLLQKAPYSSGSYGCNFCDKAGTKFLYHCSCELDFHIKCALFTFNIAEMNLTELEHVAVLDPLISTEIDGKKHKHVNKCFVCWEPLANCTYFSLDCGFNLHKKCAQLPLKINHVFHRKHPLLLQFDCEHLPCAICYRRLTSRKGFVYGCSLCKFFIHIECSSLSSSLPPVIEDKSHEHQFTLIRRRAPFYCDACGDQGDHVGYTCYPCNIIVHNKCISLPHVIKSKWHDHLIFHNYFLEQDFKTWDCIICNDKVNEELGNYSCLDCKFIFHVNCVLKDESSYFVVTLGNEDEKSREILMLLDKSTASITSVFQRNNAGDAIEVKHIEHKHNLMLSDKIGEYEKSCDGCMLPLSDSFYYCPDCDFFLHKVCAISPKIKHVWDHKCEPPLVLTSDKFFFCVSCGFWSNAFAYKCSKCKKQKCLRCVIARTPGVVTSSKHQHPLFYYKDYRGQCSACGLDTRGAFRCKDPQNHFVVDHKCLSLPTTARHKCDEHLLVLTYHDDNLYSESQYCDICEEMRDPDRWYYHCATCRTSAHIKCVLGQHPFVRLKGEYKLKYHPHPVVTLVKNIYYYPNCAECKKPCQDVAFACATPGCNYMAHLRC